MSGLLGGQVCLYLGCVPSRMDPSRKGGGLCGESPNFIRECSHPEDRRDWLLPKVGVNQSERGGDAIKVGGGIREVVFPQGEL